MTQKDPDLQSELEELKARVRALTEAQEKCAEATTASAAAKPPPPSSSVVNLDFDELVDSLKQEIEDLHPLTCLAVFGLGVLVGRLLAQ